MGAITWAIIGICYMIYSEFQGSDKMFNRRFLPFTIPENVTRLGLYWYPRNTMNVTYSRLFRQVVAVAAGQQYRVDYFNWADLASNARGTLRLTNVNNGKYLDTANGLVYFNNNILQAAVSSGLFMFPYNVLYCGYNREIEKLPITASIA